MKDGMNIKGEIKISGNFDAERLYTFLGSLPHTWRVEIEKDYVILKCDETILS